MARKAGRPLIHLESSSQSKEELARAIQQQDGVRHGLICVLTAVEPCQTFRVRRNLTNRTIDIVPQKSAKCLHMYVYRMDHEFGFMHVRLQTWVPFSIQVCVNGREWLANTMRRQGMGFTQADNRFTKTADYGRAQQAMDTANVRVLPAVPGLADPVQHHAMRITARGV